jgi:hypothetical protein
LCIQLQIPIQVLYSASPNSTIQEASVTTQVEYPSDTKESDHTEANDVTGDIDSSDLDKPECPEKTEDLAKQEYLNKPEYPLSSSPAQVNLFQSIFRNLKFYHFNLENLKIYICRLKCVIFKDVSLKK